MVAMYDHSAGRQSAPDHFPTIGFKAVKLYTVLVLAGTSPTLWRKLPPIKGRGAGVWVCTGWIPVLAYTTLNRHDLACCLTLGVTL